MTKFVVCGGGSCADAGCTKDKQAACDQEGKKIVYGQKPPGLMGYLVARFTTDPGQVVCDPFMGSGECMICCFLWSQCEICECKE